LSSLPAGERVPQGERWNGIPAQPAGDTDPAPSVAEGRVVSPAVHGVLMILVRLLAEYVHLVPLLVVFGVWSGVAGVTAPDVVAWIFAPTLHASLVVPLAAVIILSAPVGLLLDALLCRIPGRVPTGTIHRWSSAYLKVWLKTGIVDRAGTWLSGTLFWPVWLRLAGMRVGRGCEISTIIDVVPEHLSIGDECFFADGIYPGGPVMHQNTVRLARTRFGNNTFLGNHVVVPAGQELASDILLGVCTVADDTQITPGSSWFGQPPFLLPRREVVEMDRSLTHDPGFLRYANRALWEVLRFALPVVPLAALLGWFAWVGATGYDAPSVVLLMGHIPSATTSILIALCLAVLCLKWILLGRVRPAQHPLWSCWCSRWDFLYVAWGVWARRILSTLEGTLLLPWYLRAMGSRIGKGTVLGSGFAQVVDPDMIEIADHATFNGLFQAHSFEDRVLKIDRVQVQSGATVAAGAVLLYGCEIGTASRVASHSVVMKRERLLPGADHEGCPTR
jgi:non-ribosomal peptide synthetase-like protein